MERLLELLTPSQLEKIEEIVQERFEEVKLDLMDDHGPDVNVMRDLVDLSDCINKLQSSM